MGVNVQQWEAVQSWLKSEVGEENFNSWLSPLTPDFSEANETNLTLAVPTRFMRDWIARHYGEVVQTGIATVLNKPVEVNYIVRTLAESAKSEPVLKKPAQPERAATPAPTTPLAATYSGTPLDPRFTFDNFVTGKSNEFAHAAARRIAESDDLAYNPFFLYGGVGLGKTHLMHAIAHHIGANWPERRVLYISSETFVHQFVRSLRDRSVLDFKEQFRSVDVLMIDDVQFIAGKEASQEEFFHTFNALVEMRKQVILTADRSPHELDNIEDRLRSRLGSGLATQVHQPDMETRLAILEKKAEQLGIALPKPVAMFLADKIATNVREMEGALKRLAAHAQLVQAEITIDFATEQLKDLLRISNRKVSLDDIQKKVAEHFNIKVADMHSARRSRNVARPRQIAMYLSKQLTTRSFPDIGRAFGGRDHTTVIHACRTVEGLLEKDESVKEDVHLLEKMLGAA